MFGTVEHEMFVNLVAHRIGIVFRQQRGDEAEIVGIEHLAGGVHRRVQDDELGLGREGRREFAARQGPVRRLQAHKLGNAAGLAHDRQIAVVQRFDHHHFVARRDQTEQATGQRFGRPRGHEHFARRIDAEAVEPHVVRGHGFAQFGHAPHGRVLIGPVGQERLRAVAHVIRPVAVGKPLAEIDRAMIRREARHHLEDRSAHLGEDRVSGFHLDKAPVTLSIPDCVAVRKRATGGAG